MRAAHGGEGRVALATSSLATVPGLISRKDERT